MLKTRYDFGTNKKKTNGYTAFKKKCYTYKFDLTFL